MFVRTWDQAKAWFAERGVADARADVGERVGAGSLEDLPIKSLMPVATALASVLSAPARAWSCRTMVWVHDPGVWPSAEHLRLFYLWKRAHGVPEDHESHPAYLFMPDEGDAILDLVYFGVLFGWGLVGRTDDGRAALNVDNDGRVWVASDPAGVERVRAVLGGAGPGPG